MSFSHAILSTDIELTPEIKEYVSKKVAKIERLIDKTDTTARVNVEVGKTTKGQNQGDIYRAEMMLTCALGKVRAESIKDDLRSSIDDVQDEIVREIKKLKGKKTDAFLKGARAIKSRLKKQ